jgi:hypothetical protein
LQPTGAIDGQASVTNRAAKSTAFYSLKPRSTRRIHEFMIFLPGQPAPIRANCKNGTLAIATFAITAIKKTSPLSELVRINTTVNFLICLGADRPDPLHQRGLLGAQMGIQREATAEGRDPTATVAGHAVIFGIEQPIGNDIGDFGEFCRAHTARGHGR